MGKYPDSILKCACFSCKNEECIDFFIEILDHDFLLRQGIEYTDHVSFATIRSWCIFPGVCISVGDQLIDKNFGRCLTRTIDEKTRVFLALIPAFYTCQDFTRDEKNSRRLLGYGEKISK